MTVNRCESGRSVRRGMIFALVLLVAGALALCLVPSHPTATVSSFQPLFAFASAPSPQRIAANYGQLPLIFEANQGQSDPRVKFMARGAGYGLFLTSEEAVLSLQPSPKRAAGVVRMSLAGANANTEVSGSDLLPGKSNYLIGSDASKWRRNVPQFARVRYSAVYPGIDLVYYGNQGELEYDFEVAPGADPKQVALNFQGADRLSLDGSGNLVVAVNGRDVKLEAPRVYQTVDGDRKLVSGRFALRAANQVGFELGAYDRSRTLVIDPVLTYSTYLGGNGAETLTKIAVDSAFSAYVSGTTTSTNFPIPAPATGTPLQPCIDQPGQTTCTSGGVGDTFIAKFDSAGATLVYATYLGGDGQDVNGGIAVDSGFSPVVVGTTNSTNFPTKNQFQGAPTAVGNHVYVAKLDSTGQTLVYSTYLRGTGAETATGVALDLRSKIYVTGTTTSTDFPTTTDAFQHDSKAANQFFIARIDPATSGDNSRAYATYFGGGNPANGVTLGGGIAVDKSGGVYITGGTNFLHTGTNTTTDFPILNAFQACLDATASPCPTNVTATDAFVAKLNPALAPGSQLIYSTYIGGTGEDIGNGIAVDSGGMAYVTGSTNSSDIALPTSTTPFQKCLNDVTNPTTCTTSGPNTDAFLAKLGNFTGGTTTAPNVTFVYFSYLGGSGNEAGQAIAVDTVQGARITGSTDSGDFHVLGPATPGTFLQTVYGGGTDAFATRIDTTATSATAAGHYSTYLGGSGFDTGTGIAVDNNGVSYISGQTASTNFPTAAPFQGALNGSSDAFVTKLGGVVSLSLAATPAPTPNPVGAGNPVTFSYKVTNNGDLASGITLRADVSAGSFGSVTASGGNCGSPTGVPATVTCNLGTLNSGGTTTLTIVASPTAGGTAFSTSAVLISPGTASASASVDVTDYDLSVSPNSQTVVAGKAASYTAQVVPHGSFPNTVSVACSGLPTGTSCSLTPNSSITNLTNGSPQSRTLVVNTTARVTTTVELEHHRPFYAVWLPVSGLAFLGLGVGGTMSRRRRALLGLVVGMFVTMMLAQAGCGSSSKSTTTTTGTPAGTYNFTVTATSSAFSRSQTAQLIVQ